MRILVTSGHSRSKYTIALLSELKRSGYNNLECVQVRTFQLKRFKFYLKQYGLKTVYEKFIAHFYSKKSKNEVVKETIPISEFLIENDVHEYSVKQYCTKNHITFNKVSDINTFSAQKKDFDLIIYSGGGILRKSFISRAKIGVLNAHSGPLPLIRGMNAIEWSLFNQILPRTTIHFIDNGIDTGRIILSEEIPYSNNIYTLRGNAVVHNVELLCKVLRNELYNNSSENNSAIFGKQYFVMHPTLKDHLRNKMKDDSFYTSLHTDV